MVLSCSLSFFVVFVFFFFSNYLKSKPYFWNWVLPLCELEMYRGLCVCAQIGQYLCECYRYIDLKLERKRCMAVHICPNMLHISVVCPNNRAYKHTHIHTSYVWWSDIVCTKPNDLEGKPLLDRMHSHFIAMFIIQNVVVIICAGVFFLSLSLCWNSLAHKYYMLIISNWSVFLLVFLSPYRLNQKNNDNKYKKRQHW